MAVKMREAVEELAAAPGKAEIIQGRIVPMSPTGDEPGYAGDEIFASLRDYTRLVQFGRAVGDNKAFLVHLPHRESVSPDAAFYTGPRSGMRFFPEAPAFAAEVRSEGDYGPRAERAMADKRADYFAAGTRVVWDVDLLDADVIKVYRADAPDQPTVYRRGDLADAEPAVPGWRMAVDALFE